jgi:glycosyltransferase involved in cell wall biosynthesis
MSERQDKPEISVVIPVGVRHADVRALYSDYKTGFEKLERPYEVIFVLDGRHADVSAGLAEMQQRGEPIVIVSLTKTFGEATALMAGFEEARGATVMTLPAYFQVESNAIPVLVKSLENCDVAIGRRWPRSGGRLESMRRAVFHRALRWTSGLPFSDLGCSARVMKRRVIEELYLYGDQHRFLAVLTHRQGFRVTEITVRQSPKDQFEGHYRPREYIHRALDLVTVLFLVRFTQKPLRFFGMVGLTLTGIGVALLAGLIIARVGFGHPLADRPALLLSSLLVVLGLQLFALGLLGELIIFTHARDIKDHQIESIIHFSEVTPESAATDSAQDRVALG